MSTSCLPTMRKGVKNLFHFFRKDIAESHKY